MDSQQRPCCNECKLRHLFLKILQAGYGTRTFLNLIENNQIICIINGLRKRKLDVKEDFFRIEIILEKSVKLSIVFKIEVMVTGEGIFAKFFEQEGFSYLPCTTHYKWFPIYFVLPLKELFE